MITVNYSGAYNQLVTQVKNVKLTLCAIKFKTAKTVSAVQYYFPIGPSCVCDVQEGDFSNPFAEADRREQQKRKAEQQSQLALPAAPAQQQQPGQQPQGQAQPAPTSAPQLGFGQAAPASSAAGKSFDPVMA